MVNTIQIEHAIHNNRIKLFMKFPYDTQTIELAKTINGVKWSHTHKAWYLGYHPEAITQVNRTFVPKGIRLKLVNTLDDVDHVCVLKYAHMRTQNLLNITYPFDYL
ncbi:MAG: hypothetical protein K0S26_549 [Bacteroidota bacterium]|nr:hypothetical protein [Bacteroidota bacterium]